MVMITALTRGFNRAMVTHDHYTRKSVSQLLASFLVPFLQNYTCAGHQGFRIGATVGANQLRRFSAGSVQVQLPYIDSYKMAVCPHYQVIQSQMKFRHYKSNVQLQSSRGSNSVKIHAHGDDQR